jgi:hypothetical protein
MMLREKDYDYDNYDYEEDGRGKSWKILRWQWSKWGGIKEHACSSNKDNEYEDEEEMMNREAVR